MDLLLPFYTSMLTLDKARPSILQGNLNGTRMLSMTKSIKVAGGLQCILTNDGYVIPISIRDGLPHCPFTDEEWESLLHVVLTGDADWDPSVLDLDLDDNAAWFDVITNLPHDKLPSAFDEFGDYNKRIVVQSHDVLYSWDNS